MLKKLDIVLVDECLTETIAQRLAKIVVFPSTLSFKGEIGAGKTTFIRALLRALGISGQIKSPTFSLVESYCIHDKPIHHFDLYRVTDDSELEYIGFRDYFSEQALCCIEWPEQVAAYFIKADLEFKITNINNSRLMQIQALTVKGQLILADLHNNYEYK